MEDCLVLLVYAKSKNIYSISHGCVINQSWVLDHIKGGGTIRAITVKHEDITDLFLKRLLKHVMLTTTEAYAVLRAGWTRKQDGVDKCQTPSSEPVCLA